MRNLPTKNSTLFVLSILAILVSAEPSLAVQVSLTKKGLGLKEGNYGTVLAVNEVVEIGGLTRIDQKDGPLTGTIYLNGKDLGLGVQRLDEGGSKGISGGGGDQDEAVVINFIGSVYASSLKVGLADYEEKDDYSIVTLTLSGGDELVFTKNDEHWNDAISFVGKKEVVVDFGVLVGQDFSATVSRLSIAETEEHLYVNGLEYQHAPEPATIALLTLGGLVLCIRKK